MIPLTMVVALARNGAMGLRGGIPWRISEDMRHFRDLTMGHTLIVGRTTWSTLPPLPGRSMVLVSRTWSQGSTPPVCHTIEEAIQLARTTDPEPVVIGGAQVYAAALPYVTRIHVTEIDREVEADTFFCLDRTGFRETSRWVGDTPGVQFVTLDRVSP